MPYCVAEKETLVLLWALHHFKVHPRFRWWYNPLTFLLWMYNHNQRLMRWPLLAQDYNLVIKHIKVSENQVASTLSRLYVNSMSLIVILTKSENFFLFFLFFPEKVVTVYSGAHCVWCA